MLAIVGVSISAGPEGGDYFESTYWNDQAKIFHLKLLAPHQSDDYVASSLRIVPDPAFDFVAFIVEIEGNSVYPNPRPYYGGIGVPFTLQVGEEEPGNGGGQGG